MFKESDKVVCVDDVFPQNLELYYWFENGLPKLGLVYTVISVQVMHFTPGPALTVRLVGLPVIYKINHVEYGWVADRFRKLEEIQAENKAKKSAQKQLEYSL